MVLPQVVIKKENNMSDIKKVLDEALGIEHEPKAPAVIKESVDPEVARIVELSGLGGIANKTSVAGEPVTEEGRGIGLAYQRQLDQLLSQIEDSIAIMKGRFVSYKRMVDKLEDDMTEDEQMHYRYGVQAMIDILESEVANIRKLG